ncbi:hypothetical protein C2E23DRAFT_452023 [Lenzites betulinus]|nr:hypothetical protein C2E23DRAFT_452023 [Lenzites betulinus]
MAPASSLVQIASQATDESTAQLVTAAFHKLGLTLVTVGVTTFFGGNSAVQGMATIHLFEGRRWFGWHNTPGSHSIAKKYGRLANSPFWGALFPGSNRDPTHLFGLNAEIGPYFVAAHSPSAPQRSGFPAYLVMHEEARGAKQLEHEVIPACEVESPIVESAPSGTPVTGTTPSTPGYYSVTIIEIINPTKGKVLPLHTVLPRLPQGFSLRVLSSFTVVTSIWACVMCAWVEDWWCFTSILLGIVASGLTCLCIGSAQLVLSYPPLDPGTPAQGRTLLYDEHLKEIAVLHGSYDAVNALTRGHFHIQFKDKPTRGTIGVCSLLLRTQSIAQLILVPQGKPIGEVLFLLSLGSTWCLNAYLSALGKEHIQTQMLLGALPLKDDAQRRPFRSRTAQVVYAVLALQSTDATKILDDLLPNDTPAWRRWKQVIVPALSPPKDFDFTVSHWNVPELSLEDRETARGLFQDAEDAWAEWRRA